MKEKRAILIIATLDTKSEEVLYLRRLIQESGLDTAIVDTGILGEPQGIVPDVTASETAEAAGTTLAALRGKGVRGLAIELMLKGAVAVTARIFAEGRIHGAISMGGAEGGVMAAAAMQVLPPGFPKIIITPLASGIRPFGPFVGIRDIMVMHSLVDIAGINEISRSIFDNAAAAICGMVKAYRPMAVEHGNLVAVTTLGTTDRALKWLLPMLEEAGYKPVIFHSSGVGGQVMEDMIDRGFFSGVVDMSTNELTDYVVGGGAYHNAGPHRLEAAGRKGIPQVVSTGCMDFFAQGAKENIPEKWRDRKSYYHNPSFTLLRPTSDEMRRIGELLASKLNRAKGPVRVVLPLKGMSIGGVAGGIMHDPEGDRALFDAVRKNLNPAIPITEVEAHVNEKPLVEALAQAFLEIMPRREKNK